MGGTINALGLLTMIGVTIVLLVRSRHKPWQLKSFLAGIGVCLFLCLLDTVFVILDYESNGIAQVLIHVACIILLYPSLDESIRRKTMIVLIVTGWLLSLQFAYLVRTSHYTSNPEKVNHWEDAKQKSCLTVVRSVLNRQLIITPTLGNQSYPAGPILQSPVLPLLHNTTTWSTLDQGMQKLMTRYLTSNRYTTHPLWHTWLTGIYGKQAQQVQLWYPGGKLKDAIANLHYQ